jgi:hypothetical protein
MEKDGAARSLNPRFLIVTSGENHVIDMILSPHALMGEVVTGSDGAIVKPASGVVAPPHFAAQHRKAGGAAKPQHSVSPEVSGLEFKGANGGFAVPFTLSMA